MASQGLFIQIAGSSVLSSGFRAGHLSHEGLVTCLKSIKAIECL